MTDKEAMQSRFADDNPLQGKRVPQFEQRAIPLSGKLSHNRSRMGLNLMGSTVSTQRAGPNIASTLIISMTLAFPEVILLESGLSFLGLGVQPPSTSLGNMVGYGREYLTRAPWILLAPAFTIILTTLAISIVGDWLRDRLDPTLR